MICILYVNKEYINENKHKFGLMLVSPGKID